MAQFAQLSRPPPPCQRSLSPIDAVTGRRDGELQPLDRCYVKIEIPTIQDRGHRRQAHPTARSPSPLSQVEMETCHRSPRQPATVYL